MTFGHVPLSFGTRKDREARPCKKPVLLLDVDGVLSPFGWREVPSGYREIVLEDFELTRPLLVSPRNAVRLRELQALYEVVWATGWRDLANQVIAPLHRLPTFPVILFPPIEVAPPMAGETWKLPVIREWVAGRSIAWLDDDLNTDAFTWASGRSAPSLLLRTDPRRGFGEAEFRALQAFGDPARL